MPTSEAAATVDAVAASPAVLRELTAALAADLGMLRQGRRPVAGRLAAELIARESKIRTLPGWVCRRAGVGRF